MLLVAQVTLAVWLDRQIARRGLSQNAVAVYCGVSHSAVSEWRKGNRIPDPPFCWKLAEFFHAPVEEVMRMAGHLPPESDVTETEIVPELASRISGLSERDQRWLLRVLDPMLVMREETEAYDALPPAEEPPAEQSR